MKISRSVLLKMAGLFLVLLFVTLLILAGIWWYRNPRRFPGTATLMTDRPEFTAYAELFNARQDEFRVNVIYREDPALAAIGNTGGIDLVVAPYLNNPGIITTFRSLDSLFPVVDETVVEDEAGAEDHQAGLLDTALFYRQFLERGRDSEGVQRLLPVSFDLPALSFLAGKREAGEGSFSLNLESIREESSSYNQQEEERYTRMGFSPRWNPEVLYVKTSLFETSFHSPGIGKVDWDGTELERTVTFIRDWIDTVNMGLEKEQEFIDTFLYDPPLKLLIEERILFAYMTLSEFFRIAPERRSSLDFQWMARRDIIPVEDDALFIGIPGTARARPAAEAFLLWFFSTETQTAILEANQFKRMRTFGIADGLSSLPGVNENQLPRFFPSLVGHIPPEDFLRFPLPLPARWSRLKEEIVIPWLQDKASVQNPDAIPPLEEQIELWFRQRSRE